MNYQQWELVFIKFPFTDLSDYKLRPALVISNQWYNKKDNVLLVWVFGNEGIKDFSVPITSDDLQSWKMLKPSFFRLQNVFSLDKKLIEKKIWKVKQLKLKQITEKLTTYIKVIT